MVQHVLLTAADTFVGMTTEKNNAVRFQIVRRDALLVSFGLNVVVL
ncbi:hypothetical protein [Haladaptatus pallidirubidus]|nr:hypothetical protein [Haladaptatus pallidirubidus]